MLGEPTFGAPLGGPKACSPSGPFARPIGRLAGLPTAGSGGFASFG